MKKTSTNSGVAFKKYLVTILAILCLASSQVFAHSVDSYSGTCASGPQYKVTAVVSNVNSSSNYRWQWKNSSNAWVCFVNGANVINGISYNVSGAVYNLTTTPGPIIFTNPGAGLEGLQIRMVISDGNGVNPCNLPAGNTWTSVNPFTISVNNTPCAPCTAKVTSLYFNELNGGADLPITNGATFTLNQLGSLYNLEASTSGTVGSVKYTITGPTPSSNIENTVPYNSPATGGGAWTGAVGTYTVNLKTYSASGATGNLCHDTTITFNVTTFDCNCPGTNLVLNPGFESGTTSWSWSGGTLAQGTGAVACGSWSGDLNNTSASSKAWQSIGTNLPVGTVINASVYAGTHDNTFNNWVAIEFLNASNAVLSSSVYVQVDKILANSPAGPQLYNITATVPSGAVTTRVAFGGTGSYTKTDRWCVTKTEPVTGSIGDRVWLDANGNGIQDATETGGITGVTVQLRNSANTVIATQTTNGTGNYLFTGLAAGTYTVVFPVSISGSVVTTANVGSDDNIDSDPSQASGITPVITLATAQNITNVDAGYCPVNLQIGNRVWYDTDNDGINDATENGIRNVTVRLYKDDNNDNVADGAALATVLTDINGNYLFSNLAPGNYIVGAVAPNGYVSSAVNGGDPDNNTDLDDNGQVTAAGNEMRGLAITITGGGEPSGNTNNTYDFGFLPDCACVNSTSNLLVNPSFENGTTGWSWSGGTLTTGTGYVACGTKNGFNDWASGTSKVWQDVNVAAGSTVAFSAFAGTHAPGIACSPKLSLVFLNSANATISQTDVTVTRVVGDYNNQLEQYSITAVAPAGTVKVRVQSTITCNTMKLDAFCLTVTAVPLGSIGDRVWKDTDGDGIQDAGEVGVAGITIVLLNSAGQPIATTTTDAFGNYKFSGLPAGNYSLRITPPANYSLSAKTQGSDTNLDSDFDPITYTTGTVALAAGQNRTDIDAGLKFSQPLPASVGDRVWLDTNADGVQDAGEPGVSNVLVTLYNSSNVAVRYTYTDVNGNYLFTDVTPGAYTVGVTLPPAFVFTTNSGAVSSATNSDVIPATGRTASFTVNAGDQITYVDAGIKTQQSTNGSVGDFVWNDLNKDGVQDAGEPGIAGVTVRLLNAATNAVIATTTTDAAGKYIFNDVPAGDYKVEFVTPAGYTTTTKLNSNVTASGTDSDVDPATSRTANFTLAAGQRITSVDAGYWVTTGGTGAIGDRVWLDANQNGIQDAGETNVQGMTVTLYDATNTAIKSVVTDANGNYLFTDLAAGNYTVGFSNVPAGFTFTTQGLGTAATGSDVNPATGRTATIALAAGQTNLDVDAGIRSAMAGTGSIGNRVWSDLNNNGLQDAGEVGIAGVVVELLDAAGNPIDKDPNTAGVQPTTTITNALGEYLFTGLAAGDYRVRFGTLPAGYNASPKAAGTDRNIDSDGNAVAGGTSTTDIVSLANGEERLDIDLGLFSPTAPLGQLGDRVWFDSNNNGIQDATEQGVPGVSVSLLNASNAVVAATVTDANGLYRFVNLAAGTYSVKFSNLPAGFTFSPANQGGDDAADSDADPATGITGTYTIAAGTVNLTADAGIYSTRAALGDYVWFDADNDGTQDATEKGVAGVTVTLYDAANVAVTSAITDQNGRYFFSNLNPGTYTVGFGTIPTKLVFTAKDVVAAGDAADSDVDPATARTGSYTLAAGQVNLTVDAGLKPLVPATVGDFVWFDLDRNGIQDPGEPGVPGVIVTLYNAANQVVGSAVTDGNGYYLISNVPAGTGYYAVFSNTPDPAAPFTLQNVGGSAATDNSKADATGKTTPFTVAEGQNVSNIDAGVYRLINIHGNVWNDANGLTDLQINKTGTQAIPNSLNIYLVDANTNQIIQAESINLDGTYSFFNVEVNTSYKVVLSTIVAFPGQASPIPFLPSGWQRVGENLGAGPLSGSDGVPNGLLFLDTETSDVYDANFGIRVSSGEVIVG
ncbi:MAG: carboxypeptidase regulatory-like domain-containing protein [Ferruginibacter sp.]|nr:carboxypeptidase regulatory-like domain-containing protein [Ferruginibacter sp.]